MTTCIAQLNFSFYRSKTIHVDFYGGQITSYAGLLSLSRATPDPKAAISQTFKASIDR
jgi:hypothetical protein